MTLPFFVFVFVALIVGMIIRVAGHPGSSRASTASRRGFRLPKPSSRHSEADRQKAKAQQIAGSLPAPDKRTAA